MRLGHNPNRIAYLTWPVATNHFAYRESVSHTMVIVFPRAIFALLGRIIPRKPRRRSPHAASPVLSRQPGSKTLLSFAHSDIERITSKGRQQFQCIFRRGLVALAGHQQAETSIRAIDTKTQLRPRPTQFIK